MDEAVQRRLHEELRMTSELEFLYKFQYDIGFFKRFLKNVEELLGYFDQESVKKPGEGGKEKSFENFDGFVSGRHTPQNPKRQEQE